jgi:hypothetical protein
MDMLFLIEMGIIHMYALGLQKGLDGNYGCICFSLLKWESSISMLHVLAKVGPWHFVNGCFNEMRKH